MNFGEPRTRIRKLSIEYHRLNLPRSGKTPETAAYPANPEGRA